MTMRSMTVVVEVQFDDHRIEWWFIPVDDHSDFKVTNVDAIHTVRKQLGQRLADVRLMMANGNRAK